MGRRQHLLNPLAGAQKGSWIAEVTPHHLYPLLLQMSKIKRGPCHHAYWFALCEQALSNNAAQMPTSSNDQDHVRLLIVAPVLARCITVPKLSGQLEFPGRLRP